MSTDPKFQAALALHRFGLGPKAGLIDAIASDPRGALLAELEKPGIGLVFDANLMSASKSSMTAFMYRQEQMAMRIAKQNEKNEMANAAAAEAPGNVMAKADAKVAAKPDQKPNDAKPSDPKATDPKEPKMADAKPDALADKQADDKADPKKPKPPNVQQRIFRNEARAHFIAANTAEIGFVERLVWFWSNHFCVSADVVPYMAGGYEREAIRPHVLGRFADMLVAAEGHPAMLIYLDNFRSVGPKSVAGLIGKVGLNENFAREILELHTLGVRTGYTQADIIAFAKVLTGWTILPAATNPDHGSEFVFNPRLHEPGPQTIMGKVYAEVGVNQGRAVFADLARHPATATHVATKLARHFVADDPPPALVKTLEQRFRDSDGDLKEIAKALVAAPETWDTPMTKLKRPNEWLTAMRRAIPDAPGDVVQGLQARARLGEPLWRPPQPEGFSDVQGPWADGLAQRLDIAEIVASRVEATVDPKDLLETTLGPLASADTRRAVARADSRQQAIAIALMAPEFHRR
ncbi:MAG TPA: DUF1800 family protein [Xanthobacteraceae bacterium]|nr:DUF1800 family protein [Xanthobacteraceae bacterium]